MTPPGPIDEEERRRMQSRRRGRSIALLVALLALSGLFYAISLARVGRQVQTRRPPPGAAP